MGRPKGTKNIIRTPQEKERLILEYKDSRLGCKTFAKSNEISSSLFADWLKKYDEHGIDGLKSNTGKSKGLGKGKGKGKGNKISALYQSKSLTELERKDLEILKLKIENERLKKGYLVKGVGSKKEFITLKEMNSKSSKN